MTKDLLKRVEELELDCKNFGFYWETIDQLLDQIQSECLEVKEANDKDDRAHLQEEIGDLIHAAISLAIFCKVDPHETLKNSIDKFKRRYDALVELVKKDGRRDLRDESFEVLNNYWKKAKKLT